MWAAVQRGLFFFWVGERRVATSSWAPWIVTRGMYLDLTLISIFSQTNYRCALYSVKTTMLLRIYATKQDLDFFFQKSILKLY